MTNSNSIQYITERYQSLTEKTAIERFEIIREEVLNKFDFILSSKKRMQNLISEHKRQLR